MKILTAKQTITSQAIVIIIGIAQIGFGVV